MHKIMKRYKTALPVVLFLLVSAHVKAQYTKDQFAALHTLEGKWKMPFGGGVLYEVWEKPSDTLLTGIDYRVTGKDTVEEETIRLSFSKGVITYAPRVAGQNGGGPVEFILVSISGEQYVFENPEHDFPQQIVYNITGNRLDVTVGGNTPKGPKKIPFGFEREEK
jgi:hypothetical protein